MDLSDVQLFMALARVIECLMGNFNGPDLDNTAWAFATAGEPAPALLNPISVLDAMEANADDS